MKNKFLFLIPMMFCCLLVQAQKKPLDHTVYDGWQSIGERKISNDGRWVLYVVAVQEGDNNLVLQRVDGSNKQVYARGYDAAFSNDNRYAFFKIKPLFADTRQAKIKKKKPEEMPKDSLAIIDLTSLSIFKTDKIKSYKVPEKGSGWIAYHKEKSPKDSTVAAKDTLRLIMDTSKGTTIPIEEGRKKRKKGGDGEFGFDDAGFFADEPAKDEGTTLVIRNLANNEEQEIKHVEEYLWSEQGNILVVETTPVKKQKDSKAAVLIWRSIENRIDTICRSGNDFKGFAIDEKGYQVAFTAERDSSEKALQKFYKLYFWQNGDDTARIVVDRNTAGMQLNWTVSENARTYFSKSGRRLFFGTAPVQRPKDTTLVEMDLAKLDVWHYNDDYLQPQQLKNLDQELKRSYISMLDIPQNTMIQLADEDLPQVLISDEGDGDQFAGITDKGNRISGQWEGTTKKDIYSVNPENGSRVLVRKGLYGTAQISPKGRYIIWYDSKARHYFSWANGKTFNLTEKLPVKVYDELNDVPADPGPYGMFRWQEQDAAVFIYDRFDVWKLDPLAREKPVSITKGEGRKTKTVYRYMPLDPEERFLVPGQAMVFRIQNEKNKNMGWARYILDGKADPYITQSVPYVFGNPLKAKNADYFCYTRESYIQSPDLYSTGDFTKEIKLSDLNPQQANYTWGTSKLFYWKAYNGKEATGIVYKPENYVEGKKYPLIVYFYETLSDGLNNYIAPAPTPSRLNISFFVSRGYIVLAPDIYYADGHPGRSGYDYVVSGARALARAGMVDSTRMGIQGQSWGGYQVSWIITRTNLFAAAWAGAPVANMTSAYGGIRWESGMNRQFQYEKTQSRIGATLWEKPQLYIENSPLFALQKVKTPLVIMSNDADGAVPWYQGIEMFTAMRRLNKKVWLLNYNGEAHNLVERRNRKDISIREQQFFDWLLRGEKPTRWLTDGIPATLKGKDWGLE